MEHSAADLLLARRLVVTGRARHIREAAGLSRLEVSRAAGISKAAVRAYEDGYRRPTGTKGEAYGQLLRELIVTAALAGAPLAKERPNAR